MIQKRVGKKQEKHLVAVHMFWQLVFKFHTAHTSTFFRNQLDPTYWAERPSVPQPLGHLPTFLHLSLILAMDQSSEDNKVNVAFQRTILFPHIFIPL